MRGKYGYRGTYSTDYYHITCLLRTTKAEIEKNIAAANSKIDSIRVEITYFTNEKKAKMAQVRDCQAIIQQILKDFAHRGFWWRARRWLGSRYTLWSEGRKISRLERDIDYIENKEILERETCISELRRRIFGLESKISEIDRASENLTYRQD